MGSNKKSAGLASNEGKRFIHPCWYCLECGWYPKGTSVKLLWTPKADVKLTIILTGLTVNAPWLVSLSPPLSQPLASSLLCWGGWRCRPLHQSPAPGYLSWDRRVLSGAFWASGSPPARPSCAWFAAWAAPRKARDDSLFLGVPLCWSTRLPAAWTSRRSVWAGWRVGMGWDRCCLYSRI